MRILLASGVVSCLLLAPAAATAGLSLGARLGVAVPGGEVTEGARFGKYVDFAVPMQLALGWRFERLGVGAYFRAAPGRLSSSVRSSCDATHSTCWATNVAFGLEADVRLGEGARGPWVGGFAGIEILDLGVGGGASSYSGPGLGAQGGYDFAFGRSTIGPYGQLGIAQYQDVEMDVGGGAKVKRSIPSAARTTHTWFSVGARYAFTF